MSELERPYLKSEHDNMPRETYAGLGYPTHRFADFIPVADGADQFALRASIESIGLIEPIMLFEGAILDGRHRYAACTKVGVEPRFVEFEGDEEAALQYVLGKNIARRNLTTAQKLSLRDKLTPEIERLRKLALERKTLGQPVVEGSGRVDEAVAAIINVSRETQRQYDVVKAAADEGVAGADDFLERMLNDEVSVKKAYAAVQQAKTYDPDELDRIAKKQASLTDTNKLKAQLASAIGKAHALLINADPSVLTSDWTLADQLTEMQGWIDEALDFVR